MFCLQTNKDKQKMKKAVVKVPSKRIFTHQGDQLSGE
jgi:hypothetical protein